jgi:hypothetical protein
MLPTHDPITLVSAPKARSSHLGSAAWLRVEHQSGRRFQIVPIEQYFADERYPRLALAVEEVQEFKEVLLWPGGPVLEWTTPGELQPLLSRSVHAGLWIQNSEMEPPEGYEAKLSNGANLRVWHSQATPMSVEYTVSM